MVSRKVGGFTLIELLIASSILSAVLLTGYYSYSMYSKNWNKYSENYWREVDRQVSFRLFLRSLGAITSYIVEDSKKNQSMLFYGGKEKVQYVTSAPIFSKELAVVELKQEKSESGEVVLVYSEKSLDKKPIFKGVADYDWDYSVIILSGLDEVSFSYQGWNSFLVRQEFEAAYGDYAMQAILGPKIIENYVIEESRILPNKIFFDVRFLDGRRVKRDVIISVDSYFDLIIYLNEDYQ